MITLRIEAKYKLFTTLTLMCFFTPPSGRGQVMPFFRVFLVYFLPHGHLPQTPRFCLAKQIFVPNFRCTTWAHILSDCNIFCTLGGGKTTTGSNAPGAFLVVSLKWRKSLSNCLVFVILTGAGKYYFVRAEKTARSSWFDSKLISRCLRFNGVSDMVKVPLTETHLWHRSWG